jgi:hypothetical protein
LSVLLYGSETWKVAKTTISKLQVFVNHCLRRILNIHWPEVVSNEERWRRAEETEISTQIRRRKWNWIGHTLRKGHDTIERVVLDWNPQGQRRTGRPKETWRRSVHSEALGEGKSWGEVDGDVLLTPYVPKGITGYDDDDDDCVLRAG